MQAHATVTRSAPVGRCVSLVLESPCAVRNLEVPSTVPWFVSSTMYRAVVDNELLDRGVGVGARECGGGEPAGERAAHQERRDHRGDRAPSRTSTTRDDVRRGGDLGDERIAHRGQAG
ncbi:hypothetical protein P9139_14505 [Curtobacterium flaccumfaciens]|nr:hypothetical protein P9139_14505 [Curtobacterium flaccumfaciens]